MSEAAHRIDLQDARARILAAALEEFSRHGVEGATLRQIAERAGTQHQLIVYHFKTKDALWKAVVSDICAQPHEALRSMERDASDPTDKLRRLVRGFVELTARQPQLHRMVTFEGRTDSERLRWWLSELSSPFYALSTRLIRQAQEAGHARQGHPGRLHYAMVGVATTSFTFEHEYRTLTGLDPFNRAEIEAVAGLACDLLGLPQQPTDAVQETEARQRAILMAAMLRAVYWFDEALQAGLAAHGEGRFSRAQSMLIVNVVAGENRSARIADNLGVTRQAISLMIRDLIGRHVLHLEPDPADRRARIVAFDPRFRATAELGSRVMADVERALEARIGSDSIAALRHGLQKDWGPPPIAPEPS